MTDPECSFQAPFTNVSAYIPPMFLNGIKVIPYGRGKIVSEETLNEYGIVFLVGKERVFVYFHGNWASNMDNRDFAMVLPETSISLPSAEHFFQIGKLLYLAPENFKNVAMCMAVSKSPKYVKKLNMSSVKLTPEMIEIWKGVSMDWLYEVVSTKMAVFKEYHYLVAGMLVELSMPETAVYFVEANPHDNLYGIGKSIFAALEVVDGRYASPDEHPGFVTGQNKMGVILTDLFHKRPVARNKDQVKVVAEIKNALKDFWLELVAENIIPSKRTCRCISSYVA
jgi:predicted NAD-dependent protein-ADP-ribosyltransferase YbiA (DUF1768 family)